MDLHLVAATLLGLRILSVIFISLVVIKQVKLVRDEYDPPDEEKLLRVVLLGLGIVILAGQFIPILIDMVTIFTDDLQRGPLTNIGIAYAFSNAFTSLIACVLLWIIYRISLEQNIRLTKRNDDLQHDKEDLKAENENLRNGK